MTLVFMFPGQSSRSGGTLERIVPAWPPAALIVERASQVLERDLRTQLSNPANEAFSCNRDVQVGVFLTSYLHQQALEVHGIRADVSLGLSLGEYNHLVHSGAIEFDAALKLVDTRGRLYDSGSDGMMAAIFPHPVKSFSHRDPKLVVPARHRRGAAGVEVVISRIEEDGTRSSSRGRRRTQTDAYVNFRRGRNCLATTPGCRRVESGSMERFRGRDR